jgi:hypothetical protein
MDTSGPNIELERPGCRGRVQVCWLMGLGLPEGRQSQTLCTEVHNGGVGVHVRLMCVRLMRCR